MSDGEVVTVPEAARMLRVGTTKAWQLAREGRLPGAFRIGERSVRVNVAELRRWLERESTKPAA